MAKKTAAIIAATGIALLGCSFLLPAIKPRSTRHSKPTRPFTNTPSIDVLIPAYLEANEIGKKILDIRDDLRSSGMRGRIIVISGDPTTTSAASGADLIIEPSRRGKAHACNEGINAASADIVVFTDANCRIEPATWPRIVASELEKWHLVSAQRGEKGGRDQLYWKLESIIKSKHHAELGTMSIVGEMVAMRRTDYAPIDPTVLLDDFAMARSFHRRGLSVTASANLTTTEQAPNQTDQWLRRVRITTGLLREGIPALPELARSPLGRQFIAHKLYRSTVGCLGFWIALGGTLATWPGLVVIALPAVLMSFLGYSGKVRARGPFRSAQSAIAMQFLPPIAFFNIVKNKLTSNDDRCFDGTWTKVAR